jgi:pimeloyl-ACP methyl ester carboxylesterase/DNA-binding CsgD family transcriptional regulator
MIYTQQRIGFCTAPDGVRIAYATVGEGPPLVKAANFLSHLQFDWLSPVWRHWLLGLSTSHQLVRYDERGCGLSDWDVDEFSVDAWVRDLETVVEALGLQRFSLLGISQGGPVAISYAMRHPEKVSHLILYGSYARGRLKRNPTQQQLEEIEVMLKAAKIGWGRDNPAFRQLFTSLFMPEGTAEQVRWFNELERVSTSADNAVRFLDAFYEIDVTEFASGVSAPTLVMHAREDGIVPFEEGLRLAALIPHARFVPLEGKNHILLQTEPAWEQFLAEIHDFLGVGTSGQEPKAASSQQPPPKLTQREWEVANLIIEGKSNREIADVLIVSERTVEGHVSNILAKLGFHTRAQISAWVVENARSDQPRDNLIRLTQATR